MTEISLFASQIQRSTLSDAALLDDLHDAVWMIEDGDTAGHEWCDREGYPGYTSYASLDDLPQRAPAFSQLVSALNIEAAKYAAARHWELGAAKLHCDSLWINILGEGGHHSGHIHPNSVISGTCYLAVPESAGRIKFEDPRLPMMMAAPAIKADAPESARRFHYISPQAGDVLMWESWLRHEVITSQSEAPRISISFNYALTEG
ncbi:MAG: TIGR02466 family protein [Hyphomonadaceae bacterium]|nr:TIGR02466 family protein [Hyphomonadaceae bacterium]